ncbi:hypothetical protein FPQ18DRAFT_306102 [Pyronema domesticum]|nr:hypothetical protein FPQ18DRAFT_306102 [Pyronema domesticum]
MLQARCCCCCCCAAVLLCCLPASNLVQQLTRQLEHRKEEKGNPVQCNTKSAFSPEIVLSTSHLLLHYPKHNATSAPRPSPKPIVIGCHFPTGAAAQSTTFPVPQNNNCFSRRDDLGID